MKSFIALAIVALLPVSAVHALELTAAVGRTGESTSTFRLGVQHAFNRNWFQTPTGRLTGYWDTGYTYWEGKKFSSNHSISFAPVFVYEFRVGAVSPYVEAGVGIAAFENTKIENRGLGSSFQFEDRLGAGLRFAGRYELGLRAIHYSNAGIKQPNDGIESYTIHYRALF